MFVITRLKESTGWVVKEEDSWQEIVNSNLSTDYLVDVFKIDSLQKNIVCLTRQEINEKEAADSHYF